MIDRALSDGVPSKPILAKGVLKWEPFAMLCARFALGAAFLSAVAARFGILGRKCRSRGWFPAFQRAPVSSGPL
jgi:hypothetical protein